MTRRASGRPVAVATGGAVLVGSVGLIWVVGGAWVAVGLVALLAGAALVRSASSGARSRPAPEADNTGMAPSRVADPEILARAVRHDLPLMAATAQGLPSGGLPEAGLLAEHSYVTADALHTLLARHQAAASRTDPVGRNGLATLEEDRAAVAAQLWQVETRAGRLYSAERPGGLDHLDWHLARLWILTDEYLAGVDAVGGHLGDGTPDNAAGSLWPPGVGHRRRARVLAWTAVATGTDLRALRAGRPLATRFWLALGIAHRARQRSARLWGGRVFRDPTATGHGRRSVLS